MPQLGRCGLLLFLQCECVEPKVMLRRGEFAPADHHRRDMDLAATYFFSVWL